MYTEYKLVILLIIIYMNFYTNKQGSKFYNNRLHNKKTNQKIYDIGHKYLPNYSKNKFLHIIHDYTTIIIYLYLIIFNKNLLLDYVYLSLIIKLIRSFTIPITILPKDKNCKEENTFKTLINGSCYDKIFSGHFSLFLLFIILMLLLIIFRKYLLNFSKLLSIS